ncbi:MAG: hypothetical protein ACI9UA_005600 [Pseudoalteromonas tetraodonis]
MDEDGDSSDWLEIFNNDTVAVNLAGHYLTDDPAELQKWIFPAHSLAPNGFVLVFASGKNRAVAGAELHTNFSLDSAGDYLALVAPDSTTIIAEFTFPLQFADVSYGVGQTGNTTPRVLVNTGANCTRLAPVDNSVDATWTGLAFDDSNWTAATTGIGYENVSGYQALFGSNGDVSAELAGGAVGVYIRVPFTAANPTSLSNLTLKMKYDDGFVAYLNGNRITSGNAAASTAWDSFSTGDHPDGEATQFEDHDVTANIADLEQGTNMLAIHLMNGDAGSSDLLAIPELHGVEITDPSIGEEGFLATSSPGAFNGDTFGGFVGDTNFSITRGFFDAAFDLEITSATPNAVIRYTLNGDPPTLNTGTVYSAPIPITATTVLRSAAFKDGLVPTNVDTQSYFFVDDIIQQDAAYTTGTAGLPALWGGQSPDYGLDTRVTQNAAHSLTIRDDLKSIPSLSIVMDVDDMFGGRGIYSNPGNRGSGWERATSLELVDPSAPDGSKDFQVDCAIRIQGGAFRSFGLSLKKSFRVLFKSEYGPSKLRYPFFGPDAAQEFDTLTFRMEANDGYQWGNRTDVQYARDEFGRRSQLALGWPSSHGRYMHIYINGVYWGVYNTIERPDAAFGETYFPGADKAEWDGLNNGSSINEGNTGSWNTLNSMASGISSAPDEAARTAIFMQAQGLNPDGSENPVSEDFINIDNYIDYLLVNFYGGNADWPGNNWYAGRARGLDSTGFHFFMWDAEWSLFLNSNSDRTGVNNGVCTPYGHLRNSLEFRTRFGDRAHRALFNGGALTPQMCVDRWQDTTKDHTKFMVGELARWGDQHNTLRTMQNWISANNRVRDSWMATRTAGFVDVLKGANLYPETDAPVFSQHGGSVSPDTSVTMATDADKIYYTLDGRDPRLLGAAPDPSAQVASFGGGGPVAQTYMSTGHAWNFLDDGSDQGTAWRAIEFDDAAWESGPSQLGYGGDGEATLVSFGGDSNSKFATTYYRTTVDIPDPSIFVNFLIRLRYDDAAAVYLNGNEIIRTSNLPTNATFGQYATSNASNETAWFDFTFPTTSFNVGTNTLAVEIHQGGRTSSDTRMDMVVRGEVSPGGGANVSDPLFFAEPTMLTSRSFNSGSGEWSALNSAFFTIDTVPADASNLVISEIHYRPENPTSPEELAVSSDRDDYEFIELQNIGAQAIDLCGVRFFAGIKFTFPPQTQLEAGGRMVLARDLVAFQVRYPGVTPFAQYSGRLSNDGELIQLLDADGGDLRNFSYNDQLPWPTAPDGDGFSLVLIAAMTDPEHADPASWRPSSASGGSPGDTNATTFAGGADEFLEYALLGSSQAELSAGLVEVDGMTHSAFTFPKNHAADDVLWEVEYSTDLTAWQGDATLYSAPHGVETWRAPSASFPAIFWRVRVSLR